MGKEVDHEDDEENVIQWTGNEIRGDDPEGGGCADGEADEIAGEVRDPGIAGYQEENHQQIVEASGDEIGHHDPEKAEDGDDRTQVFRSAAVLLVGKLLVVGVLTFVSENLSVRPFVRSTIIILRFPEIKTSVLPLKNKALTGIWFYILKMGNRAVITTKEL